MTITRTLMKELIILKHILANKSTVDTNVSRTIYNHIVLTLLEIHNRYKIPFNINNGNKKNVSNNIIDHTNDLLDILYEIDSDKKHSLNITKITLLTSKLINFIHTLNVK